MAIYGRTSTRFEAMIAPNSSRNEEPSLSADFSSGIAVPGLI